MDFSETDEILHKDYGGSGGGGFKGVEGLRNYLTGVRTIMSNPHWETLDMVAEGNWVSTYHQLTGIFDGEYQGIKGKGQPVSYTIAGLYEFKAGKVYRGLVRTAYNFLDIFQQIGVLPSTEEIIRNYNDSVK
jgi:predicted ester cyclase